jgi:hypothetical protein
MKLAARLTVLLAALLAFSAQAADVTGEWAATIATAAGRTDYTYALRQDGSRVFGTIRSPHGVVTITNGYVNYKTVTFDENITVQGRRAVLEYTGEIVSDTEIRFERRALGASYGVVEFVATRAGVP